MTKTTSLAFIDKKSIDFFVKDTQLSSRVDLPPTIVKDGELINKDELNALIKSFVETNKIPPGDIVIVLSDNLFFMKDFPETPANQQKLEIEKYLDIVPFENLGYKTIPLEKGFRLIATNRDLFEVLTIAFEHCGFSVLYILPAHITGIQITTFGVNEGNYILGRLDILKQYNLVEEKILPSTDTQHEAEKDIGKKSGNKFAIIGGIILLLIVGVLAFLMLGHKG